MTEPTLHDLGLPRRYAVQAARPPPAGPNPDYEFRIRPGWRDCPWLTVRFGPLEGSDWVGAFELGDPDVPWSGFYPCPSGEEVLLIAWGAGYFVTPSNPNVWYAAPFDPVRGVLRVGQRNELVVWGDAGLLLLDANGPKWRIDRLSEDQLTIDHAERDFITGLLREPDSEDPRPFSVRSEDGEIMTGPSEGYLRAYVRILRRPDDRLRTPAPET